MCYLEAAAFFLRGLETVPILAMTNCKGTYSIDTFTRIASEQTCAYHV